MALTVPLGFCNVGTPSTPCPAKWEVNRQETHAAWRGEVGLSQEDPRGCPGAGQGSWVGGGKDLVERPREGVERRPHPEAICQASKDKGLE